MDWNCALISVVVISCTIGMMEHYMYLACMYMYMYLHIMSDG